jgi:hypothetical protein
MQKILFYFLKWTLKDKIYNNHVISNLYIYGKFQCTSLINFSFDDALFFIFYFDIILTLFLSPHFSFSLWDKCSVIISKVHYKSIMFLEFIQNFMMILIKVYEKMNNLKIDNVDFEYGFKFYICM